MPGFFRRLFGKQQSGAGMVVSKDDYFHDERNWEAAPSTSHLHSWAYWPGDRRGGQQPELWVRFKDPKTGGVSAVYAYEGVPREVYEPFRRAAHPGQFGHRYIWFNYKSRPL